MKEKIVKAVRRYLQLRGWEVEDKELESNGIPVLVAEDEDDLVFCFIFDNVEPQPFDHGQFAKLACAYLADNNPGDKSVRADRIGVQPVNTDQAFVQHVVGWSTKDNF